MDTQQITDKTYSGLLAIWHGMVAYIPDLIVGIIFITLGWIFAKTTKKILNKTLDKLGFNVFIEKSGMAHLLANFDIKTKFSVIIASLISVFVFFLFLLAALDILGLTKLSSLIDAIALYLPKVFAAFAVLIAGFFIGQLTFNGVKVAASNTGIDYGRSVAEVCRGIVIIITLSLSITQLDIDVSLINTLISVVIGCIGLAAAISLGTGTKTTANEIVSGVYLRELFNPGDELSVNDIQGTLISIGSVSSKIMINENELATVPNTYLLNNNVKKTIS